MKFFIFNSILEINSIIELIFRTILAVQGKIELKILCEGIGYSLGELLILLMAKNREVGVGCGGARSAGPRICFFAKLTGRATRAGAELEYAACRIVERGSPVLTLGRKDTARSLRAWQGYLSSSHKKALLRL